MKQWTVDGADRETGQGRTVKVLAGDEGEAERMANAKGVLVSRVYVYNPASEKPSHPLKVSPSEAKRAGWRLRAADRVLSAIGCMYAAMAILIVIAFTYRELFTKHDLDTTTIAIVLVSFAAMAGVSILFFGMGAALKMLAIIGERGEGCCSRIVVPE
jgi:hypothetical protein